jgi:hypothetical protein
VFEIFFPDIEELSNGRAAEGREGAKVKET